jgi:hypothetical protein
MHSHEVTELLNLQGHDERPWEGHLGGDHWIARVVYIDILAGICALHVATGADRDQVTAPANCKWDFKRDHFLGRFSNVAVPPQVTDRMHHALREWFQAYQAEHGTHGCYPMSLPPPMTH